MEHELFQSKLKPLVDSALIPYIIENSSSGEHPYRTAALELILEMSIQERRKRVLAKVKTNTSQQDPPPQPKPSSMVPKPPIQQAQPPVPVPQPQPQPPSGFIAHYFARNVSAPTKVEASSGPPTIPKTVMKTEVAQQKEPPADTPKPVPSEDVVELVCMGCGVKQRRHGLASGLYCASCPRSSSVMRCVGCGIVRAECIKICTNCRKKFK